LTGLGSGGVSGKLAKVVMVFLDKNLMGEGALAKR